MKIEFTDQQIAAIQQGLYVAHCMSMEHRGTYAMFCDKVAEGEGQDIKQELQHEDR